MVDRVQDLASNLPTTDEWKERALDAAAAARERFAQGSDVVRHYTIQQPAKALGIALGMGVLLGWLIKRR